MVLSTPGRADEKDVGGVLQKAQGGELADHGLVYLGLGVEVEVGDVPGGGQTGEARGPPPGGRRASVATTSTSSRHSKKAL
jgi:hypothetical protein